MSPAPKYLFVRCKCCGEVFSRCTWLPHCNNFTNRPILHVRIKPHGRTLGECFGEDLKRSMDFVIRHGQLPADFKPTKCVVHIVSHVSF